MNDLFHAPWLSLLTFLLGLLAGHYTALWRDRRKDFNTAAMPVITFLLRELARPTPFAKEPSSVELHVFEGYQTFWRRSRFRKAWRRQQQEREKACRQDAMGQPYYADSTALRAAIEDCLVYARLR